MAFRLIVPITLVVALAGCGSIGAIGLPWKREPPAQPVSTLPPPADGSVQSADIGPPGDTAVSSLPADGTDTENQPLSPPAGSTAMTAPTGSGANGAIGRTDLLGGWTITSAGDSCQLFMTLTSWTGGYRASTRGCTNEMLKSISAWNLQGTEVVLAGQGGNPIARLASAGNNRFDGRANGQGVTFYR